MTRSDIEKAKAVVREACWTADVEKCGYPYDEIRESHLIAVRCMNFMQLHLQTFKLGDRVTVRLDSENLERAVVVDYFPDPDKQYRVYVPGKDMFANVNECSLTLESNHSPTTLPERQEIMWRTTEDEKPGLNTAVWIRDKTGRVDRAYLKENTKGQTFWKSTDGNRCYLDVMGWLPYNELQAVGQG